MHPAVSDKIYWKSVKVLEYVDNEAGYFGTEFTVYAVWIFVLMRDGYGIYVVHGHGISLQLVCVSTFSV